MIARCHFPTSARRGFSLVELLVVLAVLVVLAMLIVPTVNRGAAIARRVKCASNLSGVGQAYAAYHVDRELRGAGVLRAPQWAFVLRAYYGELAPMVFMCPEDLDGDWAWPDFTMESEWEISRSEEQVLSLDPVWLEGDHSEVFEEDNPAFGKRKLWKVNDDVYQAMLADVSLRREMPKYTPGSNPKKFWFIYEDWGDEDFYDFDLGFEEVRPGYVIYTAKHWANAHARHFLIEPDGARTEIFDDYGPVKAATPQTSYGMNSQAFRLSPGDPRIVFLDYERKECSVMADIGADEGWDELHAPRHLGQMNAAMGDGSVVAFRPDQINPEADTTNIAQYWGDAD